ncbi:zinc ribbon domain-containing protein YjdM [Roseateles oligotrophus]|uniref:Alkylphosphonate utilization protein n=1 Tax=Roseateles oligotrophus TaxID=1769250 RepID=A0ABT2YEW8_9BURK|nr:zinc ribbon domain-containing protein YjdM [Roseateles oligotrophus]MCV2368600.1 alkylphosphonate utilization protein [Roseateles oligotrophus]
MSNPAACPVCTLENTYRDGEMNICPDCGHEWGDAVEASPADEGSKVVRDANGQVLVDGDSVILVKDLKVKGSSITLKKGAKAKGIRLVDGDHDVDCKIDGVSLMLKSEFLKKA